MSILIRLFNHALKKSTPSNGLKLILALTAFYLYKYRSHAIGTRRRLDLKQPKGAVPLLGHLFLLSSVPLEESIQFFEKQYNELGPVWSISLPGFGRLIQIDTPENIEHVLKTNFSNYQKGELRNDINWELTGHSLVASDGAKWKYQRQIWNVVFKDVAIREYVSNASVAEVKKAMDILGKAADEGTVIDLQKLMLNLTLDILGAATFGKSFGCLEKDGQVESIAAFEDLLSNMINRLNNPFWKITERLNGTNKRVLHNRKILRDYAQDIMNERRRNGYHSEKKDLLQSFIEGKDDEGETLSDELIKDNVVTVLVAGSDTTALSLTWIFYLLLRDGADKNIMNKLVQEVDEVLGGSAPSYETSKKQKYAEACQKDDVLPDGTVIHAGELVSWSAYAMGRSEILWGPDAKEFKPSRWINTEKPSQSKFITFNAGPRVCIGQQFATIEVLTILGMILKSFNLELEEPSKIATFEPHLTLKMAGGLKVRVSRRSSATAI
ncbi:hypothetical protein BGX26_012512 [Mortierella sp. AD094]|nr:hypothetical protein BGX26_012512 [Mortierella sp. AD094]